MSFFNNYYFLSFADISEPVAIREQNGASLIPFDATLQRQRVSIHHTNVTIVSVFDQ